MGHILKMKPVFKEMIWEGKNSVMFTDMIYQVTIPVKHGRFLHIKMVTA